MFEFLLYSLFYLFLFVIACWLGHLTWVHVLSKLNPFSKVQGENTKFTQCRVCNGVFASHEEVCPYCAWETKRPGPFVPARVSLRLLTELERRGFLTADASLSVRGAISRWQAYLSGMIVGSKASSNNLSVNEQSTLFAQPIPDVNEQPNPFAQPIPDVNEQSNPFLQPIPDVNAASSASPIANAAMDSSFTSISQQPTNSVSAHQSEVTDRVERFKQAMQTAAAQVEETQPVVSKPTWSQWLAAFMEEKHIRWGEVIGGLLIVCCSIALVISFWAEIADRPLLKFGVFNGVTAALFGLGIYAGKRWQLPTTSTGLLSIATLLLPLNFLAIAAFTQSTHEWILMTIAGELISISLFAWLLYQAADLLIGRAKLLFAISVLGPCVTQLVIRRFIHGDGSLVLVYVAALVILLFYNVSHFIYIRRELATDESTEEMVHSLYKFLGLTSFSILTAFALLLFKTGRWQSAVRYLSPASILFAMPTLWVGLWLWRQCKLPKLGFQTVGASLVVLAAMVIMSGVVLAWPDPVYLCVTGVLLFCCMSFIAWGLAIPEAHGVASLGAVICYTLMLQIGLKNLSWQHAISVETMGAISSASSAKLLGFPALIYGIAWFRSRRKGWLSERTLGLVAGAISTLSLALISYRGFGIASDPLGVTWVYGLYAVAFFIAGRIISRSSLDFFAASILLGACVQGFVFRWGEWFATYQPRALALFAHASLLLLFACANRLLQLRVHADTRPALGRSSVNVRFSLGTACIGMMLVLAMRIFDAVLIPIGYPYWLAAIVLSAAWLLGDARCYLAFQWLLAVASILHVHHWLGTDQEMLTHWAAWWQPLSLQANGIVLALLLLVYQAIGWGLKLTHSKQSNSDAPDETKNVFKELTLYSEYGFERIVQAGLLILMCVLAVAAAAPGIGQELSPRAIAATRIVPDLASLQVMGLSPSASMGWPSWLLTGILATLFITKLLTRYDRQNFSGLVLCLTAACTLAASYFVDQVAVASALRWFTAIAAATLSAVMWCCSPWIVRMLSGFEGKSNKGVHELNRDVLFASAFLIIAPMFLLAGYVGLIVFRTRAGFQVFSDTGYLYAILVGTVTAILLLLFTAERMGRWQLTRRGMEQATQIIMLMLIAPFVAVTIYVTSASLKQHPIVGPDPASFLGQSRSPCLMESLCC